MRISDWSSDVCSSDLSLVIRAAFFDGLQPDVVVVESIWPNRAFEEGRGINLLTSADRGRPAGGAVFHFTAVCVQHARGGCSPPLPPGHARLPVRLTSRLSTSASARRGPRLLSQGTADPAA